MSSLDPMTPDSGAASLQKLRDVRKVIRKRFADGYQPARAENPGDAEIWGHGSYPWLWDRGSGSVISAVWFVLGIHHLIRTHVVALIRSK